jgi:hypothetical protein
MDVRRKRGIRYPSAAELVEDALPGDAQALYGVFQYLSSATPELRQIMLASLHDTSCPALWRALLNCLAHQRWMLENETETKIEFPPHFGEDAWQRVVKSISEAFVLDETEGEKSDKENILTEAQNSSDSLLRHAAAYLRALRGSAETIPQLAEMIETAEPAWQMRAVEALAALQDERSGPVLIRALEKDRADLHKAAQHALFELGSKAQRGWLEALNHPNSHIRWHAARGLGQACDARAADILVEGLLDESSAVRWATAGVLANLDALAVPAILSFILHHPLTEPVRQAISHAIHSMPSQSVQDYLQPLMAALSGPAADLNGPATAQRLLAEWKPPAQAQSKDWHV